MEKTQTIVTKQNPEFTAIKSVINARSNEDTRYFMKTILFEEQDKKTTIISTDGKRLHLYTDLETTIKPDLYTITLETKDTIILTPCEGQFPNYRRAIPEVTNDTKRTTYEAYKTNKKEIFHFSTEYTKLILTTQAAINIKYLQDLPKAEYRVHYTNNTEAITFTNDSFKAIIMPMLLPNQEGETNA